MTSKAVAWLGFDDINSALQVASLVRSTFGADVEALEQVDDGEINCVLQNMTEVRMPLSAVPAYSLIIEIATPRPTDNLNEQLEEVLVPPMEEGLISDAVIALSTRRGGFPMPLTFEKPSSCNDSKKPCGQPTHALCRLHVDPLIKAMSIATRPTMTELDSRNAK